MSPSIGGALKRKQAGAVASPRPKRAQYLGSDTPGGAGSARGRAHAAGTPQLSSAIESSARVDEDYMEANRVARCGCGYTLALTKHAVGSYATGVVVVGILIVSYRPRIHE